MLQTLTVCITSLLSLYIAGVDTLALKINHALDIPVPEYSTGTDSIAQVVENDTSEKPLPGIASLYEYGAILPDILIKNADYQQAAVSDSLAEDTTKFPLEEATVNILCTYTTDTFIKTTTGTGFFVNDNGVILTNAHVAQFLLLRELEGAGQTKCTVGTGIVSQPTYEVDLLYISPAWIQQNADLISQAEPKGTGERDYALLYITKGVDNQAVPNKVPYLKATTKLLTTDVKDSTVTIGGYPAEGLKASNGSFNPLQQSTTTTITELYTFGSTYADIFTVDATTLGQHGISGGPVIDKDGHVIGMISTKGDPEISGAGSLNAITLSYISRTIEEETTFDFNNSIGGNLPYRAKLFRETLVPFLTQMIASEL